MRTTKLKFWILCIFVCCLVGMMDSPAAAVTIIYQSANTDIDLTQPYGNLEFENPLAGTEMIKGYDVIEWRDADYAPGPPPWYDDWSVSDPAGIDGYANEIWMRTSGHSIWTTTTVASTIVSIHLHGDDNDGLADILVDDILVARLDMGTSPGTQNALIIVKNLAYITHHIRVNDLGGGPSALGTDVATMGAAALEKRIKWSQPPKPAMPDNLYYGWNEISIYDGNQIVADDWQCDNDDPVTDVHWWGSFKGWIDSDYPPATQAPTSFHITIWTDVPDPAPDDPDTFSHPNEVVWEIDCYNFTTKFVGWDYDPRTNCYEACFYYEQDLTEAEYFYQHSNPDGTPSIYWISIAAKYPAGSTTENLWGWKTRRRNPDSPAPDDAVKIKRPTTPQIGDRFQEGKPIYWPDETQSWDMAFELTAQTIIQGIKWEQKPEPDPLGGPCYYGWDEYSIYGDHHIVADDWACDTPEPVTDIHWWGSYIGWNDENPPPDAPNRFHIAIWTDVPAIPEPYSHPRTVIWEAVVPRSELKETFDGCDSHPINPGLVDSCFRYEYIIPRGEWFYQEPAGVTTIYWLSIAAVYGSVDPQFEWGWKTRPRNPDSRAPDDAVRIYDPTAPTLGMDYILGVPIEWQDESYDTAFVLTTQQIGQVYYKWSQPPEKYETEAFDGWNESSVYYWNQIAADDWFCDTDDPVTDIHWWGSFIGWSCEGQPPQIPDSFHIAIWTDVQPVPGTSDFSHPGVVIWETNCNNFTSRFVGWDIDPRDQNAPPEACFKFEQDLPEEEWFYQQPGGNIYWLSIAARYPTGTDPVYPWGWKTRRRDINSRAPDDAVRINNPTDPILGSIFMYGQPIWWPDVDNSWDLAFELTTKEIPPKKPVPHLKWSQPPIEMDPSTSIPIYCGWDEPSYTYFPPDTPGRRFIKVVADDYRCIGNMPVTSLHWWGSYIDWDLPTLPMPQPVFWMISFWSNVPASGVANFSYPEELLHQIVVQNDQIQVERVGRDEFPLNPDIFPETCFQYHVDFQEEQIFWQGDYIDKTQDNTFWVSIEAIYSSTDDVPNPWGWKTRPWKWMDDAVTFDPGDDYPPIGIPPTFVLDPANITPIEYDGESYDVAFELDTDPCYIKWEQPFTGIRRWPHYHDEKSIAREVTTTENVTKWAQKPDLTHTGIDVDATFDRFVPPSYDPQLLADDFNCVSADTIDDIHIYGSWWGDNLPGYDIMTPSAVDFTLSIHRDIPAEHSPTGYSMPGDMIWSEDFDAGDFTVDLIPTTEREGYYMPCTGQYDADNHSNVYRYNFYPTDPFPQKGSPDNPIIYWLDVQARPLTQNPEARFGWKTRDLENDGHFNDDATWVSAVEPYNGDEWQELIYPSGHPFGGQSMDLAFELTTKRVTTEFIIDRLVADDWKCKRETPVTAAVWWGSYIGFRYQPCQDIMIVRPRKPDYFHLSIWTDVPAGVDPAVPFSHPNEVIWKYNAFEYDEVLVGYDKDPRDEVGPPREPVFRYSVRLPQDAWFMQEDVNNIYWFSVVAVYKDTLPNVHWGWTNHPYVFNDDAVAGYFDPVVGVWTWEELYDQVGNSEDMSFMLFTEADCLSRTAPEYSDWSAWGKPDCWCYSRQCRGDINGLKHGPFWVQVLDLDLFKAAFNKTDIQLPTGGICADLNHVKHGPFRVQVLDLDIFKIYFNKIETLVPECDQLPIYTGPYNYWTKP